MKIIVKTAFFLILVLLVQACQKEQNLIQQISETTKKHQSVQYKIDKRTYKLNQTDTTDTPYEVRVVRDASDKEKKGKILADNLYRPYTMIYENGEVHITYPTKKYSSFYEDYKGSFIDTNDWIDMFLDPEKIVGLFKTAKISAISDNIRKIELNSKEDREKGITKRIFFIDKTTLVPVRAILHTEKNGITSVSELRFSDFRFDEFTTDDFNKTKTNLLKKYPVEETDKNIDTHTKMLQVGDDAPKFQGTFFGTGKAFDISDYIGKNVIVVDFWYTHCPPCVRSMPELTKLYDTYKDKGLKIFGLNSVDNRPKSLPNLKKFLDKKKVSYDIVLINEDIANKYKVKAYPTMYVIDKKGKISFVELGYDTEKFEKFKAHIENLLNE